MRLDFQCRSCDSRTGTLLLDLGLQPLANNLLRPEDLLKPEPEFPLRLAVCHSCWLLQIIDLVPPVDLFSEYPVFLLVLGCVVAALTRSRGGAHSGFWIEPAKSRR